MSRRSSSDAFEAVPQDGIAASALIDGEIAFEHAAVRSKGLNTSFDIRAPRTCKLVRRGGDRPLAEVKAEDAHPKPPKLDVNVRNLGER